MNGRKIIFNTLLVIPLMALSLSSFAANVTKYADLPAANNDAVSLDSDGNVFVSHAGLYNGGLTGSQVYKIDLNGTVSIAYQGLSGPLGSDFDSDGNLYVSNYNSGDISKFSDAQSNLQFVQLGSGGGIVIDSQNHIYASSYFGNAIYRIDTNGVAEVWVNGGGLNGPVGLALDEDENLYVANYNDGKIFKVSDQSQLTQVATINEGSEAFIGYITMASNVIYATGFDANKIFQVTLSGEVSELSGTESTAFNNPNGIAASADGQNLFVSEYGSNQLYQIDLNGTNSGGGNGGGGTGGGGAGSGEPAGGSGGGTIGWLLSLALFPLFRSVNKRR